MARFVIANITDSKSIPQELQLELRQAQEQQQAFLKNQTIATKVVPLQNRDLDNVLADSKRYSDERIRIQDGFRVFIRHASG